MSIESKVISRTMVILTHPKGWYDGNQDAVKEHIVEIGFPCIFGAGLMTSRDFNTDISDRRGRKERFYSLVIIESERLGVAEEFATLVKNDKFFVEGRAIYYPKNTDEAEALIDEIFPSLSLKTIRLFDEIFPSDIDVKEEYKTSLKRALGYCKEINVKTNTLGGFVTNHTVTCSKGNRSCAHFHWDGPGIILEIFAWAGQRDEEYWVTIYQDLDKPRHNGDIRKCIHNRFNLRSITPKHLAVIKGKLTEHFNHKVMQAA